MISALTTYQWATRLASPLISIYIWLRKLKGKEDPARIGERFGRASIPRPQGTLWWLHAASVGEAVSLRPLLERIHTHAPDTHLLLTSGTVSSAKMLAETLPDYVIHQFIPIDTPAACKKFIDHWQPEVGVFTESELWPNLITEATKQGTKLALINARMSSRSFGHWRILAGMAHSLLSAFSLIAAGTAEDAKRYSELGAANVKQLGHLKQDAAELPVDDAEINTWQEALENRPCLIAASFHPGEDELLANLHLNLQKSVRGLLTILVPRHPGRAAGMAQSFKELSLSPMLRSHSNDLPGINIDCYIADTIGELGLWYRLADVVIMGGSFIPHGGQNPLEAIRLGRPVITGPHMHNFRSITDELSAVGGIKCADADSLPSIAKALIMGGPQRNALAENANAWLEKSPPVAQQLTDALLALPNQEAT